MDFDYTHSKLLAAVAAWSNVSHHVSAPKFVSNSAVSAIREVGQQDLTRSHDSTLTFNKAPTPNFQPPTSLDSLPLQSPLSPPKDHQTASLPRTGQNPVQSQPSESTATSITLSNATVNATISQGCLIQGAGVTQTLSWPLFDPSVVTSALFLPQSGLSQFVTRSISAAGTNVRCIHDNVGASSTYPTSAVPSFPLLVNSRGQHGCQSQPFLGELTHSQPLIALLSQTGPSLNGQHSIVNNNGQPCFSIFVPPHATFLAVSPSVVRSLGSCLSCLSEPRRCATAPLNSVPSSGQLPPSVITTSTVISTAPSFR